MQCLSVLRHHNRKKGGKTAENGDGRLSLNYVKKKKEYS